MRYAASDIGTNSSRLLIADVIDGHIEVKVKQVVTTRIGEGLHEAGWIRPKAMERTIECLNHFADLMARWKVDKYKLVATAAVREAANGTDFVTLAEDKTGLKIGILPGDEEGRLSYHGAYRGLGLSVPPIVVDVGGGSTEFARLDERLEIASFPVGAVRATEADWSENEIKERLAGAERFSVPGAPVVFVGGTATTMVAVKRELRFYDPQKVQGETLAREEMAALHRRLGALGLAERKKVPGLQPERADIILQGILIVMSALDILQADRAIVSDSDLLDGLIWEMAENR
ncbi:MAG: Ppx/GppA family phosphatase [Solirubrobacterales bacterium]